MMSCNSKTLINDKESCGLACISYDIMNTEEDRAKNLKQHNQCVDKCIKGKNNQPTPIGCFADSIYDRDLSTHLGNYLTIDQCI